MVRASEGARPGANPVTVGILSRRVPHDPFRLFGPPTGYLEECCQAAVSIGMRVVVFDAADVDPVQKTIRPATAVDGGWSDGNPEPWPDIIYDRAPVFDPLYSPMADHARQLFEQARIPFVNPAYIIRLAADKWRTYERISTYGVSLPETDRLTATTLREYLGRYTHIFIKPIAGSLGSNVIEIVGAGAGRSTINAATKSLETRGDRSLQEKLVELIGKGPFSTGAYLVQRGISPEPVETRRFPRFDLRVLMQKTGVRQWRLTGMVARVSQSNGPTTNLSTGARAEEAEQILQEQYGSSLQKEIVRRTASLSYTICDGLERELGTFGELGLDVIPDTSGKPWLIEVNAKPGRNVFKRIAYSDDVTPSVRRRFKRIRDRAVIRPFEYAGSLAIDRRKESPADRY